MYTIQTVRDGFEFLGIATMEDREKIVETLLANNVQNEIFEAEEESRIAFENRFIVPVGLGKKELQALEKETRLKVSDLKVHARTCVDCWIDGELPDYLDKLAKIKASIQSYGGSKADVTGAKAFPIDQLIEFKGGFAKCIFVQENTPSLKHYKKTNTAYCFSCSKKFDSIDAYMQIHNVSFGEAVKRLTCS